MKALRIQTALLAFLLVSVALFAGSGGGASNKSGAHDKAVLYVCPMHPEVTSDEAGKCPKCGMFLEASPSEAVCYVCPMHSDVRSDKPGKCPKCGMRLEERKEKVVYSYVCPMHPDVGSDRPGKCPKCGMFLEARPAQAAIAH